MRTTITILVILLSTICYSQTQQNSLIKVLMTGTATGDNTDRTKQLAKNDAAIRAIENELGMTIEAFSKSIALENEVLSENSNSTVSKQFIQEVSTKMNGSIAKVEEVSYAYNPNTKLGTYKGNFYVEKKKLFVLTKKKFQNAYDLGINLSTAYILTTLDPKNSQSQIASILKIAKTLADSLEINIDTFISSGMRNFDTQSVWTQLELKNENLSASARLGSTIITLFPMPKSYANETVLKPIRERIIEILVVDFKYDMKDALAWYNKILAGESFERQLDIMLLGNEIKGKLEKI